MGVGHFNVSRTSRNYYNMNISDISSNGYITTHSNFSKNNFTISLVSRDPTASEELTNAKYTAAVIYYKWTSVTAMPRIRASHTATGTAKNVMVQGGANATNNFESMCDFFNGFAWSTDPNAMITYRASHTATGTSTNCMTQGGYGYANQGNLVYKYIGNVWFNDSSMMLRERQSHSATGTSSICMVQGGKDASGTPTTNTCEFYNSAVWSSMPIINITRKGNTAVGGALNSIIIIGGTDGASSASYFNSMEVFNGNAWSVSDIKTLAKKFNHSSTGKSNNFMIQGGFYSNTSELFNGYYIVLDAALTLRREYHSATSNGNSTSAMIQGGSTAGTKSASVEMYVEDLTNTKDNININIIHSLLNKIESTNTTDILKNVNSNEKMAIKPTITGISLINGEDIGNIAIMGPALITSGDDSGFACGGTSRSGICISALPNNSITFNMNTTKVIENKNKITFSTGIGNEYNFLCTSDTSFELFNGSNWSVNYSDSTISDLNFIFGNTMSTIHNSDDILYHYNGIYQSVLSATYDNSNKTNFKSTGSSNNGAIISNRAGINYIGLYNGYVIANGINEIANSESVALMKINNQFVRIGYGDNLIHIYNTINNTWSIKSLAIDGFSYNDGDGNNNKDGFYLNTTNIIRFINPVDEVKNIDSNKSFVMATMNPLFDKWEKTFIDLNKIDSRTSIIYKDIEYPGDNGVYIKGPNEKTFSADVNYIGKGYWEQSTNYPISAMYLSGSGSSSSGLMTTGYTGSYISSTYKRLGNVWASSQGYPISIGNAASCGTDYSAFMHGGYTGSSYVNNSAVFSGNVWTSVNITASTILARHTMVGTTNAATTFGGYNGSAQSIITKYNGSIWSTSDKTISSNYYLNSTGKSDYALITGGYNNSDMYTYLYNGTIVSTLIGNMLIKRYGHNQIGNFNNSIISGGIVTAQGYYDDSTHEFNGNVWKVLDTNMNTVKAYSGHNKSGGTGYMLIAGGQSSAGGYSNSTEVFIRDIINVPATVKFNTSSELIKSYDDIYTRIEYSPNVTVASWCIGEDVPVKMFGGSSIGNSPGSTNTIMYSKNETNNYINSVYKYNGAWSTSSMTQIDQSSNCGATGSIFAGLVAGGFVNPSYTRMINNEVMSNGSNYLIPSRFQCIVGKTNAAFSAFGFNTSNMMSSGGFDGSSWYTLPNAIAAKSFASMVGSINSNISTGGTTFSTNIYNGNIWYLLNDCFPVLTNRGSALGNRVNNSTFQTGLSSQTLNKTYMSTVTMKYNGYVASIANNMNIGRTESMAAGNICTCGTTDVAHTGIVTSTEIFMNGDLLDQINGSMIDYHGKNIVTIESNKKVSLPDFKMNPYNGTWANKGTILPVARTKNAAVGSAKTYITFSNGTSTIYNNNTMITGPAQPLINNTLVNSATGVFNNIIVASQRHSMIFNGFVWSSITAPANMVAGNPGLTGTFNSCIAVGGNTVADNAISIFNGSTWSIPENTKLNIDIDVNNYRTPVGNVNNATYITIKFGQESFNGSVCSIVSKNPIFNSTNYFSSGTGSPNSMHITTRFNSLYYNTNTFSINGYNTADMNYGSTTGSTTNCVSIGGAQQYNVYEFMASTSFYENGPKIIRSKFNESDILPEISYDMSSEKFANNIMNMKANGTGYGLCLRYLVNLGNKYNSYKDLKYSIGDGGYELSEVSMIDYNKLPLNMNIKISVSMNAVNDLGNDVIISSKEVGSRISSNGTRRTLPMTSEFIDYYSNDNRTMNSSNIWIINSSTLNVTRCTHSATCSSTNIMVQGGINNGTVLNTTELYNGSAWATNGSTLNTARYSHTATGTSTNCMVQGGINNISTLNTTESYNGNTWTVNSSKLNTARFRHSATGSTTNCMVQGGQDSSSNLNNTESYNGTTWTTNSSKLNTVRANHTATGSSTNCMVQGGASNITGAAVLNTIESYNGSTWTTNGSTLNTARHTYSVTGTSTNCMVQGGIDIDINTLNTTESYNGSIWTTNSSKLNTVRNSHTATGTSTNCMVQGGYDSTKLDTTESCNDYYII